MCIEPGDYGTGDGVPRQTEAVTSKILLFTKNKG
ncbi:hypothetical protein TNCV_2959831, partial [Trichonephila clavipes]